MLDPSTFAVSLSTFARNEASPALRDFSDPAVDVLPNCLGDLNDIGPLRVVVIIDEGDEVLFPLARHVVPPLAIKLLEDTERVFEPARGDHPTDPANENWDECANRMFGFVPPLRHTAHCPPPRLLVIDVRLSLSNIERDFVHIGVLHLELVHAHLEIIRQRRSIGPSTTKDTGKRNAKFALSTE